MKTQILNAGVLSVAFLFIFGIAEILRSKWKVQTEYTRKLVHISSGLTCLSFPLLFTDIGFVVVLSLAFLLILGLAKKFELLKSVHSIERKSSGAYWFPVAIISCFAASQYFGNLTFYYLPLAILTISDPLACLVGRKLPIKTFNIIGSNKSIGGTMAFMVSALVIAWLGLSSQFSTTPLALLGIAVLATVSELIGSKGTDNISIPVAVILGLSFIYTNIPIA